MNYNTITVKKSKIKSNKIDNFQEKLLVFAIFLLMFCILSNPSYYAKSVTNGISLFAKSVLPGLLPFMFLAKTLSNFEFKNVSKLLKKPMKTLLGIDEKCFFPFFMSIISGYPIGAKITADLYADQKIKKENVFLCSVLASTSGLIFIIGSVGISMLGSAKIGVILYVVNIVSCIISTSIIAFFSKNFKRKRHHNTDAESSKLNSEKINTKTFSQVQKQDPKNILSIMSKSAIDTTSGLLVVCFYIAFFFMLIDVLENLKVLEVFEYLITFILGENANKSGISSGIMSGIIEMTRGIKTLSQAHTKINVCLISFLISFGGFSIIFQSLSFLSKTQIKPLKFILAKLLQGFVAFVLCFAILSIFHIL